MTKRETKIIKAVLDHLHDLDHGQATEVQIHANAFGEAFGTPRPSVQELSAVLNICNTEKWVNGVASRFGGKMKWNITDAGEGARLELNHE